MRGNRDYALGRLKSGVLNKTEQAYSDHLETLRRAGSILWFEFEGVTFKIAEGCRYTPDFVVMNFACQIECHEVKGFWRDDGRVKIKAAAAKFHPFKFIATKPKPKKDGGGWSYEIFD